MASVRDAFFNKLYELIKYDANIYVLSADLGAPSLDELRKNFPEHFINVGIAEQTLISVSAGLTETGKKIVAYGLNPFPMTRAFDQIRCLMGEMKIPVTLCALNSGFCSAAAGYTHMATEIFGMARMLPNLKIYFPSDETISEFLAKEVSNSKLPRYIVFDKAAGGKIYNEETLNFDNGYSVYCPLENYNIGVVSTSSHIPILRKIADRFAVNGVSIAIFDIFSVPLNEKNFVEDLKKYKYVVTLEENMLQGGLGSYVLEILSDNNLNLPVKRLGANSLNEFPNVFMDRDYLRKLYCLDEEGIFSTLNDICKKLEN